MPTSFNKLFISCLILCFLLFKLKSVDCQNTDNITLYTIDLNLTDSMEFNNQIYHKKQYLSPSSKYIFNLYDRMQNKDISFLIFQVHTFKDPICLSYKETVFYNNTVNGTNVGLYSRREKNVKFYINHLNCTDNILAYITVLVYKYNDPIPGGCNMVNPIPTTPYIISTVDVYNNPKIFKASGAPARVQSDIYCSINTSNLEYEFYSLELPDLSQETYFDILPYMLTVENITQNKWVGDLNLEEDIKSNKGHIFALVVKSTTGSSVYVPISFYCSHTHPNSCPQTYDDILPKTSCGFLIIIGLFLCYFGHYYFKTEMFLMAFLAGLVISYMVLPMMADFDKSGVFWLSLPIGIICGCLWLLVWMLFGHPLFSVMLATLNMGFLIASLIYSFAPALIVEDTRNYYSDVNFWSKFIVIMLLSSWCLLLIAYHANLLACAILGGYAIIFSIDFYIGTGLKYIIINIIKRALYSSGLKSVRASLPLRWTETNLVLLWVLLAVTGYLVQHYHNRGRPSFPPSPRGLRSRPIAPVVPENYGTISKISGRINDNSSTNETTPLLA